LEVGVGSYVGGYTCDISIYPGKGYVDYNRDDDTYISTFEVTKGE
jgi:hypothetical protein